jgi:beta-hydroxylase
MFAKRAYYPISEFPKLLELAEKWQIIREEFENLDVPVMPINRVNKLFAEVHRELISYMHQGGEYGWMIGWGGKHLENPDWLQFGLITDFSVIEWAPAYMPKTLEILQGIPGIKVCGLAKMKPNCFLTTHTHPELAEEGLLQLHITIDAPESSNFNYLNVNGEFNQNTLGNIVVFDGSQEHFAINASKLDRTILYMEFEKDVLMAE